MPDIPYELYKLSEWEVNAVASYKAIHCGDNHINYAKDLTAEQLDDALYAYGISTDGKDPMSFEQIKRKPLSWKRTVYNNFKATNNLGSICNFHGKDLQIVDKDTYQYWMFYSYPCLVAGTMIRTSDGYKSIEDVKVGDMVLTHKGRYRKVLKTMHKISDHINRLNISGVILHITNEHPMYVYRDGQFQWVAVKDLKSEDVFCAYDKDLNMIYVNGFEKTYFDLSVEVFNLEVEEDNSYTAGDFIVHNCQDLSVAGKQQGMQKDSGTRSGLLWEVERLLNECDELPQVLIMENVPQVHGEKFIHDFTLWLRFLEKKGYHNFWKDLNAKNYGVAQNRDRTFCVSFLDDVVFNFPKPIPLTKTIKDYLETDVDEKYYINSEKAQQLIDKLIVDGTLPTNGRTNERTNERTGIDLTTNQPGQLTVANCIKARYDAGISNFKQDGTGILEQ